KRPGVTLYMPAAIRSLLTSRSDWPPGFPPTAAPSLVATSSNFSRRPREPSSSFSRLSKPYSRTRLGTPAERRSPPRDQVVTRARVAIARPVRRTPMISRRTMSDLDVHDALDDERAAGDGDAGEHQDDLAAGGVVHDRHVARIDERDRHEQEERKEGQDPPRHSSLRSQCLHGAAELEALAGRVGDAVEDLGRVAASLPLERADERDLLELAAGHPLHDYVKCLVDRDTELLICNDSLEFRLRRLGGVVDDHRERADEAVTCAESGRPHRESVWKLLGEKSTQPGGLIRQVRPDAQRESDPEDDADEQ